MDSSFPGARGGGRFGRFEHSGWSEIYGKNIMCRRHVRAADINDGIEVFEGFELRFHIAVAQAKLFEQRLPQIFRDGSWFAPGRYAFKGDVDRSGLFQKVAFKIG